MIGYRRTLEIYGPQGTRSYIASLQSIFKEFHISTRIHEGTGTLIDTPLFTLEAAPMAHGTPTNAYAIILKDRRRLDKEKLKKLKIPNSPLLGKLQAGEDIVIAGRKIAAKNVSYIEKGKKVTIVMDTAYTPAAGKLARSADLLICESTFSAKEQDKAREYLHLTAADAAAIAKEAKVKALILTHISQRYEHNLSVIEKEAKKIFKNTCIVKDFDVVTI